MLIFSFIIHRRIWDLQQGRGAVRMCQDGNPRRRDESGRTALMPLTRELDPAASPLAFFGAELRLARAAAGLSQEQLGQRIGYSAALVGKVETGERAPSQDFARRCDQALPDAGGLLLRIYALTQRWGRRLSLVVRGMDRGRAPGRIRVLLGTAAGQRSPFRSSPVTRARMWVCWAPLLLPATMARVRCTWSHPTRGRPPKPHPWSRR